MTRILTVIGTRPQIIKYAALSAGLRARFDEVLVDTGQHYDAAMAGNFYDEMGIPRPRHVLGAAGTGALPMMATVMARLDEIIQAERPRALVCFGDTNSTLAAAVAALRHELPIAHVEAGERNFDPAGRRSPPWTIPEEANRVMTDQVASLLLCASARAVANLAEERVMGRVVHTGDITYDLYLSSLEGALAQSGARARLGLEPGGYYFCTVHRALNTDHADRLSAIVEALAGAELPVVLPLHPRTRKMLEQFGLYGRLAEAPGVRLLEPVGYADSVALGREARAVITDSGGVVREAYFSRVPSVYLDDTTEWIDIMEAGWSVFAGADTAAILAGLQRPAPASYPPIFGTGDAVRRTVEALSECFN